MKSASRGLRYFSRLTVIITIAVLGFSLPGYGDSYSLISDQPVNVPLSTQMAGLPASFPSAWRSRAVILNPVIASSDALVPGDVITLNLFADTVLTAQVDRISKNVNGTVTIRARVEGYPLGYVLISTTAEQTLGSILIPETGERYHIQMDTHTGTHYLLEVNVDQIKELEDGLTPIPPLPTLQKTAKMEMLAGGPLDPVNLDVMIVYTPAARQWADSSGGGIANVIAQAVAKGQLALDNSNTVLTIILVYSGEVTYTESGSSYTDLYRLTSASDDYMDEVHTLRNQYYADVVGLFTYIEDTGGLGWLLNTTSGQPEYAFSITRVQQAGQTYTYIHEMGHNMGCHHRKDQATQPGPGLFSYSAGWHWVGNDSGKYCSVMSYEDGGYSTVAYFSNPDILYQGVATGHPTDGDNARTLREIKNVIAAYRQPTQMGSLCVTIGPQSVIDAGAQWHRVGTSTWLNSGDTESGIPLGQYTVEFNDIPGWNKPANQSVTINDGQTTTAFGIYTQNYQTGGVVGWGSNNWGQATPPDGNDFLAIAAGSYHSLALKSDGTIVGWGANWYGQTTPPAGNNFIAVAAGGSHSLALKSDGCIVGWGYNDYGQATPPDGNNFMAVVAGYSHNLALKSDGSIVGWGDNSFGQATPPVGNDFTAIAAGGFHSLALKSDGSIVGWGDNSDGQATPPAGNNFIALAAGGFHSLALKSDGSIVGWGWNSDGQATSPAGNDFIAVAAGFFHSLALKSDDSIVGWGYNGDGQATPPAGNDFIAIAAGDWHSLALKSDGSIVWGDNYYPEGNDFIAIVAGWHHSLALKSDGSIVGWGDDNMYGQATPPAGNNFIAIAAGGYHSLALKSNGSIVGWGYNYWGQATPPAGNDFIAVAAGGYHSLALKFVCYFVLAGDVNNDCKVDFHDFALMAENWLIDCHANPSNPACVPK